MNKTKIRKEKLSIYLVRDPSKNIEEIINVENAKDPIRLEISDVESALLYIKKETPKTTPPWTKLFTESQQVTSEDFGVSSNVGAVFVVKIFNNRFILSFGSGFHLIKNESVERDFGLKVTLNSVDPDKLRSLDKSNYDHNPLNSRTQSTRDVDIFNLHLDSDTEMLYAVTGASSVELFGSHVTGRDALTIAVSTDLSGLPEILKESINRYKSKLPEKFSWVDNINRVRDLDEIEILDLELDSYLTNDDYKDFWLGEPEVVDWESQIGYSFELYPRTPRYVVLSFKDYINHLIEHGRSISVDTLKTDSVHINDNEYRSIKTWSVYRCLYAEIKCGGDNYILRNGVWYKVNSDFVKVVDDFLSTELNDYQFKFPIYNHDREEDYNSFVSAIEPSCSLMDKKNIKIGGAYDKLEHCDLIKDGTDFIHIKYYRSSSTLSHLFSQGFVAAEAFIKDKWYREKLNPKLPSSIQLKDTTARPNPEKYKVIYAIATEKELPKDLPFFSKVTLKNSLKTLRALNYHVSIAKIDVDPCLLVKKKFKPKS